jgi:opacity protein-like surface antigen
VTPRAISSRMALALVGAMLLAAVPAGAGDTWLGLGIGQVKPEGVNATIAFSGELRLGLGKHFALQPDIGYWKRSETVSGISVSASDFSFGATALLLLPLRPVRIYAGAGPSIHHISGDVASYGFSVASDSLTRVGITALGGLDLEISRSVAFFVAARYDWVTLETSNPDSINQRALYGGFRLRL